MFLVFEQPLKATFSSELCVIKKYPFHLRIVTKLIFTVFMELSGNRFLICKNHFFVHRRNFQILLPELLL